MAEHLSDEQLKNFATRRLSANELTVLARHLATCTECRARAHSQTGVTERVASLQDAFRAEPLTHLHYEQLVAYVEAKESPVEREIARNHLTSCAQCMLEVEELQALRATLITKPQRQSFIAWLRDVVLARNVPVAVTTLALLSLVSIIGWLRQPKLAPVVSAPPAVSATIIASASPTPAPVAPAVLAALQDNGQTIALDQTGKITGLPELPTDVAQALRHALETQQVAIAPEVKPLLRQPATLMSDGKESLLIKLQSPVGTFVNDTRPTFRWQPLPHAENYSVQVLDVNFNLVATSPVSAQTQWRITTPLRRGQEYVWQVTAEVAGQRITSASARAPEAHFKIISADNARVLQTQVQASPSHLLRGTMYAKAGLLDDAEREYQALLKENPRAIIARRLLQRLRASRS